MSTIRFISFIMLSWQSFILAGCGDADTSHSWKVFRGAAESEQSQPVKNFSDESIISLFDANHGVLVSIVDICEDNVTLRRVGMESKSPSYYGVDGPRISADVHRIIQEKLLAISASALRCQRRGDVEGNPLAIVSIVLEAKGLSVSGSLKEFIYWSEWSQKNHPLNSMLEFESKLLPLNKSGWYYSGD